MNQLSLEGCTPTPLAGYLKGLGVLRLLSVKHPNSRASWSDGHLTVHTPLSREALEAFFLHDYCPTPIMAPWNGGSGFYQGDNRDALDWIIKSISPRLAAYRECLRLAEQALENIDRAQSPKDSTKNTLLRRLRGTLPDSALDWLDTSVLLSGDSAQYPPLLGTGGNDGRLDFTNNFMQRLSDVLSPSDDAPSQKSTQWLKAALYGAAAPGLIKKAIGQFAPGQVGGPNATIGFEADSLINPWNFVLMIEGTLSFAAAAVRRNADDSTGVLSCPFTVRPVDAGSGSLGEGDAASRARGELWMPLWRQATTYPEIRALLAEGRVALGRKPARDSLDFVRAVHRLGGYRGVSSFQRYGMLKRSGNAHLATPLMRVYVNDRLESACLDDLDRDGWLTRFRRFAQGDNVAKRFLSLRKRLEDALFALAARRPTAAEAQGFLALLGELNYALSVSSKARESVPPVPRLLEQWAQLANDKSPAFRIARALSGLHRRSDSSLPLFAQLFPVHPTHNQWMTSEFKGTHPDDEACRTRIHANRSANLVDTLIAVLSIRLRLGEHSDPNDKPLLSPAGIVVSDLLDFLRNDRMDHDIATLLPGLSLCAIPRDTEYLGTAGTAPAAFALLKLCVTPDSVLRACHFMSKDKSLPTPTGLVAQLASGNAENRAVRLAWQRLLASGLVPKFPHNALPELGEIDPRRAAAALLIPLKAGATGGLADSVLKRDESLRTEKPIESQAVEQGELI